MIVSLIRTDYALERIRVMNGTKLNVMMIGLLLSCLGFVSTARAEGSRSYISATGSDNRPCSRNSPCRTFDGALTKTDAGGEIVAMDTGTYEPTTVTKSITLAAAPGADVSIRATSGNAVTVNASTGDVVILRGLRLSGPGKTAPGTNGVLVNISSPNCCISVHLESCFVSDFEKGVQMQLGVAGRLIVSDTVVRSNSIGVNFSVGGTESQGASFERSRFEKNDVGLLVHNGNSVSVSNSIGTANGVAFQANGGRVDIFNSVATKNGTGIECSGGQIRIAYSSVMGNGHGVTANSGLVSSMGNNMVINNDIDVAGSMNFVTFAAR